MRNSRGGGYSGFNLAYAGTIISKTVNGETITISGDEIADALSCVNIGNAYGTPDNTISDWISSFSGSINAHASQLNTLDSNVKTVKYNTNKITYNNNATTIDGSTVIKGQLKVTDQLTLTSGNTSAYLDVDQVGKLSQLLKSTIAGQKTVIDAGDGSKVGGVEFKAGAVTGVKSINGDDQYAKFRVTEDDSKYTFRAGNFQVTTGKENGYLNGEITFADTNRLNKSDEITLGEIIATRDRTKTVATGKTRYGNIVDTFSSLGGKLKVYDTRTDNGSETSLDLVTINEGDQNQVSIDTVDGIVISHQGHDDSTKTAAMNEKGVFAGGKDYASSKAYMSNADGSLKAASGNFTVDANGKLTAASGSKIGNITIDGGQLVAPLSGGTGGEVRVNVTDLAADHELVNDTKIGNQRLNSRINSLETSDATLTAKTLGIERVLDLSDNPIGTVIENKLYVYADGTLSAANDKFTVDADGKLISSSGSKIGDVTINGESLSNGINSITVSDLVGIQGLANTVDDRTGGIQRVSDPNDSTKHSTLIEGVFLVDNDGTARITNGFKVGADDKNSLTTSGLTAKEIRAGNDNTEFFVDGSGNVVAAGTLNAAGGKFFVSAEGNITASGSLSVAGDKFRVNADGSINANNKFIVDADGSLRASDDKFTADNEGNVRAIGSLSAAADKFQVGADGSINVNQKFIVNADGTISSEGTLSAAGGNFSVDADGALKAANNNFSVSADGKLMSASGSKIGGVTIDGESLSNGINSITVSDLVGIQGLANTVDDRTGGIQRVYDPTTSTTHSTQIEGVFLVDQDGTATITEGFKAGADGKNSLTTSGLKAKEIRAGENNKEFIVEGSGNVVATGTLHVAGGEFYVGKDGDITTSSTLSVAGDKFTVDADGALKAANNNFSVDADGALKAANNNFSVDKDGKLMSASGSKIGDVTIDGESLSYGTNSIKVSELASDHALVNDINKGNESLYTGLGSVQTLANSLDTRTAGISRDTTGTAATTIEGKLKVSSDGTVSTVNGNFTVSADGSISSNGTLSVANGKFQIDASGVVTAGSVKMDNIDAADTSKGVTVGGVVLKDKTISAADGKFEVDANGVLKAAGGNFSVDADGALKAANNNFSVDKDGKLMSANGSKIGGVTIDGEKLSAGTASITVSQLEKDNALINDATKGNESLYTGLGSVKTLANSLDTRTAGISRDTTGTATTTIEGKLKVSSDGTVKINEGDAQQVIIDSNGIKVGTGSAYINNDGFKAGADGNNSLTTSGLTAKTIKAGTNNDAFTVDENGNVVANGALGAANGAFSVDISGNVITSGYVRLNSGANSTQLSAGGVKFIKDGTTTTIEGETVTVSSSGVKKSFNLSDIADVGQNMTNLGNRIDTVQKNVDAEADARKKDVQDLNTAISKETTDRQQDVKDLNDALSKETADRQQDVKDLNDALSKETADRQQDVKDLNDALSKETADRQQDVKDLNDALSKETADRQQDVKNLNDALSKETTERQQDVKNLNDALSKETTERQNDVKRLDTAISDEAAARQKDVADLNGRVDTVNNRVDDVQKNVDAEAAARQKDVADLNGRVDTVNSRVDNLSNDFNTAINDEKTKREQEVSRLDTAINDEKTKREQDVADLNGRVDTVNSRVDNISNDFNTAINDEKTKREQEVTRLDGRIDTVNTNLGDLNDLDGDLKAREEYTKNSSVVGGINAEAAVRKEEVTRLDTAIADEAAARQADVARLDGRISDVSSRINKVGAMAAAISSLKTMGYDPESPTEFSIGLGQYKGETGVALGFFHYPNKNFMINVSLSTSSGEIMGGIGATWRFGHKSPQKLLDEQREAQVKKEIAAAEAYKAARAARTKDAK